MNIPHRPCRITILSEYAVARTFVFIVNCSQWCAQNIASLSSRWIKKKKSWAEQQHRLRLHSPRGFSLSAPAAVSLWKELAGTAAAPPGPTEPPLLRPVNEPLCALSGQSQPLIRPPSWQYRSSESSQKQPPSLTPCLLVHLPLSVFPKDVTASLSV